MTTYAKIRLSGSANGQFVPVNAASSPGVTLHTAVSGTGESTFDEIWLYAQNNHTAALNLTVEWGNSAACIVQSIPSKSGLNVVVPGLIAQNSEVIRAYGQDASKILIGGYVNRMT